MADNNEKVEETTSNVNEWEIPKTEENVEGEEAVPRGNDWEVVSLTASAYAAAPGPRGDESIHEEKLSTVSGSNEGETSRALFMSGHFVFPPSQHENLPLEAEKIEIPKGDKDDDPIAEIHVPNEGKSDEQKEEENWRLEGLNVPEEFPDIPFFGDKSKIGLSTQGPGFDEVTALHGLSVDNKEHDVYGTAAYDESTVVNDLVEASDHGIDPSYVASQLPKSQKEDDIDDSELPCGAWWKRTVASLCAQAKETSTLWSIFVAAAVMGLVVLGQRWQQERWQVLQQRWEHSLSDEKSARILSRLKDVIVGGSRRGTYITAVAAER